MVQALLYTKHICNKKSYNYRLASNTITLLYASTFIFTFYFSRYIKIKLGKLYFLLVCVRTHICRTVTAWKGRYYPKSAVKHYLRLKKNATYVCKHYMLTKKLNEKTKTRIPEYTYVPSNSILFSISPLFSLMTDVEARVICQCKPLRHYCCF